jgi:alpha 1,3-glucosidase
MHIKALIVMMAVAALAAPALAFKASDFKASDGPHAGARRGSARAETKPSPIPLPLQNCQDSAFCTRLRGNTSDAFVVDPATLKVSGQHVYAKVLSKAHPEAAFDLLLNAMDGMVRLYINEPAAKATRYQVPDVLLPGVEKTGSPWEVVKKSATGMRLRLHGPVAADVELRFSPVVSVAISVGGAPLLTWNHNRRFVFEHRRQKQEGDPEGWWAESFNTHHDSKPRGPEAISFDVQLHGFDHAYGLPERAGPFSLRPTRGERARAQRRGRRICSPVLPAHGRALARRTTAAAGAGAAQPLLFQPPPPLTAPTPPCAPPPTHTPPHLTAPTPPTPPTAAAANGSVLSEPYRLYNLDVFEYLVDSPFGLYGSIPLMLAHRPGQTAGVFWLNAAEMYVDIEEPAAGGGGLGTQWVAESGVVDVFFLLGPSPAAVSAQYASLTGGTALPQAFALGYHQCRWNYKDEADVAGVDAGFDAHNIPYDVLWLDIEHTDGKRYFTWDKSYFPTPARMQEDLASRGRRMVTIVDPHIKRDPEWRVFAEAQAKGLFVRDKEGKEFEGWCWPGSSSYLDYTSPAVRAWWADQFSLAQYQGSTPSLYVWNDMNEPSVFNGPEISMPKDALHAGGAEHRDVHNVYGAAYHAATADGLRRRGFSTAGADGDRPFVLSRAFFAGSQRLGAIWTGDNGATWEHLEVSVPMLLSVGVAGLPFSGADVGGFFGNPDAELMTRWYQVGAFYPFFRGHAHLEAKRREPWLFGDPATGHIREAIRQRYRLLPYLYTLFLHANATGAPVMRPLWYEFPEAAGLGDADATFMLGPALLVAPVLRQGATQVEVALPGGGLWYDGLDGTAADAAAQGGAPFNASAPPDTIRTWLRGGGMLPLRERARRSTAAMAHDPVTLILALDRSGAAGGDLYLDDGRSFAFQRGQYAYRSYRLTPEGALTSAAGALPASSGLPPSDPGYDPQVLIDRIVVLGLPGGPQGWGAAATVAAGGGARRELEAAPGPIYGRAGLPDVALVVRRAQLPAAGDWTVQLTRGKGAAAAVSR